jgi:hypothetical protein
MFAQGTVRWQARAETIWRWRRRAGAAGEPAAGVGVWGRTDPARRDFDLPWKTTVEGDAPHRSASPLRRAGLCRRGDGRCGRTVAARVLRRARRGTVCLAHREGGRRRGGGARRGAGPPCVSIAPRAAPGNRQRPHAAAAAPSEPRPCAPRAGGGAPERVSPLPLQSRVLSRAPGHARRNRLLVQQRRSPSSARLRPTRPVRPHPSTRAAFIAGPVSGPATASARVHANRPTLER